MVPKGGLEPPQDCSHCALNAARLPVPPLRHEGNIKKKAAFCQQLNLRDVSIHPSFFSTTVMMCFLIKVVSRHDTQQPAITYNDVLPWLISQVASCDGPEPTEEQQIINIPDENVINRRLNALFIKSQSIRLWAVYKLFLPQGKRYAGKGCNHNVA